MAALYYPIGMFFGLIGRFPWQTVAFCAAGTLVGWLSKHDVIGVSLCMLGACTMIWLDEHFHPRAIDEGTAAGD